MGKVQGPRTSPLSVEVRHCAGLEEFRACTELEKLVWGGSDLHVPSAMYVVAAETGGQVLGAFAQGRLVGFTLALVGAHKGTPYLHSHMTAVLPEFQDQGIGRRLKLFQREDALDRGMNLVEWTFDPLEIKNAHFNLVRLGAIARRYLPNCYGITSSPLHGSLPTDRLVAEWWLDSRRVLDRLAGKPPAAGQAAVGIRLPKNVGELRGGDPPAAARVQAQVRKEFQHWFGRGYVATGFEFAGDTASYVLEPA